jgi:hypothetical protein
MVTHKVLLTINLYQVAFWAMIWIVIWGIVRLFRNSGNESEVNDVTQWDEEGFDYYDAGEEDNDRYEDDEW